MMYSNKDILLHTCLLVNIDLCFSEGQRMVVVFISYSSRDNEWNLIIALPFEECIIVAFFHYA